MFIPMASPRTRVLGLVDGSDEIVAGTTDRGVKTREVHRMLAGQRGDTRYAKSIRGVRGNRIQPRRLRASRWTWLALSVFRWFLSKHRPAVPVMEPREYTGRRFYIRREVELAKYGFSDDSDGCRVGQAGAEAKPHSKGCRQRIRQAMLSDDVGQQRLHAAEQRPAPTEGQQASVTRVEVTQEGQDEEMTEALAASSAWSVRPRSAEMSSRNGGRFTVEEARIRGVRASRRPKAPAS